MRARQKQRLIAREPERGRGDLGDLREHERGASSPQHSWRIVPARALTWLRSGDAGNGDHEDEVQRDAHAKILQQGAAHSFSKRDREKVASFFLSPSTVSATRSPNAGPCLKP